MLGDSYNDGRIEKFDYTTSGVTRLVTTWNYETGTGSDRAAPMFYGDIMGDWREEVVAEAERLEKELPESLESVFQLQRRIGNRGYNSILKSLEVLNIWWPTIKVVVLKESNRHHAKIAKKS